ncbi:MAG TPA: hypothetical protein VHZ56_09920 [Devosia sp.]|jgi:hypothetical protein|nr:hypothetical protein [Devosia sp.]
MARNGDPHPEPDDPATMPAPLFPPGAGGVRSITPPRPGIVRPSDPNPAPARAPFPDHVPDPGTSKQ